MSEIPEALSLEAIARAQEVHLRFLEAWTERLPKLYQVSVVKALTYDLIQALNNAYLQTVVGADGLESPP